ncbi:class I SAM-dependent methyltransferase [Nocardioides jensenii]|uniref:class I SAM-dependent methyltransferase n=1 Tax=Nocardioides jensenii TaxID=1843 RepID=UPI00082AE4A4|nr:class I SAM-dependent methyltransferase [Nocardioides jensenii]
MNRHAFLAGLHDVVRPRTYLETGVQIGQSLQLSRVPSIGIDPEFSITREIQADVQLARTSSDEFFARKDPLAHLPIPVVDLSFIDGMHLAEYALRDFLAVERFTTPASVVLFDDTLPLNVPMANRKRATTAWTGDVYKAAAALRELRPDLVVLDIDTTVTGTTLVLCPDASRDGVLDGYDDWLESAVTPDPQPVPQQILNRTNVVDPERVLASAGWSRLVQLRGSGSADAASIRAAFSDVLG